MFGEATSPNTSREHTTRKLIVVDVPPPIMVVGLGKIPSHPPHILKNMKHDQNFFGSPKKFFKDEIGRLQDVSPPCRL